MVGHGAPPRAGRTAARASLNLVHFGWLSPQPADVLILPNPRVLTGGAEQGTPAVQRVLEVE